LLGGFRAGGRLEKNLAIWNAFLSQPYVERLVLSGESADRYGRIWAELRRKGTPIPANDIWIAAQAMETGVEVVSFDGHFECVPGLVWTRLRG
jgi:tRNA(fMet)-specific endonuclease VapC